MPRVARIKHEQAIYHIMTRGNNRENIFFDEDDRVRYLETLKHYKEKFQMHIYAYCLMDNHVHLIIDCNGQDISKIMHGINLSYTQYINRKYQRCGHLLQDRFKSIIIDRDEYIIQASKYVHNNPVKAGICNNAIEYRWSSINIYMGKRDRHSTINTDFILNYFDRDKKRAREIYLEYLDSLLEDAVSEIEKDVFENRDVRIKVEGINMSELLKEVAKYFNVCIDDITTKYSKRYANIRKIAAYIICLKSKVTYREIGLRLGITGSAVGQCIKRAVERRLLSKDICKCFKIA